MKPLHLCALGLACLTACEPSSLTPEPFPVEPAPEVWTGNVSIQSGATGYDVVMTLDGGTRPGQADGIADRVFVLQRLGPVSRAGRVTLAGARVVVRPGEVAVHEASGAGAARLGLRKSHRYDRRSGGAFRAEWEGYGLSQRTGAWPLDGDALPAAALAALQPTCGTSGTPSLKPPFARPAASFAADGDLCWSGGAGAGNCSTSCTGGNSCSTTCNEGFYACCDNTRCRCTCKANAEVIPTPMT